MFHDLEDPDPPHAGSSHLMSVSRRARILRRRRNVGSAGVALATLALVVGGVAGVQALRTEPGSRSSAPGVDTVAPSGSSADTLPTATTRATATPTTGSLVTATTATSPSRRFDRLAIGDTVLLGAAPELQALGFVVDARPSRQLVDAIATVEALRDDELLGNTVVIHLGTNGMFTTESLDRLLAALSEVPDVLLLTVHVPREWEQANNELIAAADARTNVEVLNWDALVEACPGDCFAADGFHLAEAGARYYAQLIADAVDA